MTDPSPPELSSPPPPVPTSAETPTATAGAVPAARRRGWGWGLTAGVLIAAAALTAAVLYDRRQDAARDIAVSTAQRQAQELSQRLEQIARDAARDAARLMESERALMQERGAGARAAQRVTELEAERVARETVREEAERRAADLAQTLAQRDADLAGLKAAAKDVEQRVATAEERLALAAVEIARRDIRLAEAAARLELRLAQEPVVRPGVAAPGPLDAKPAETKPTEPQAKPAEPTPAEPKPVASSSTPADPEASLPPPAPPVATTTHPPAPTGAAQIAERLRAAVVKRPEVTLRDGALSLSSDALFRSGTAQLTPAGQALLAPLAKALRDAPRDGDWALRVDGHTDKIPIRTAVFPSNWELSTARAAAVARALIESGVPAKRIVVAGYADQRPATVGSDPDALKRNRRIELSATERP